MAAYGLSLFRLVQGECRAVEPAGSPVTLCLAEGLRGEPHGLCYARPGDRLTMTWCAAGPDSATTSTEATASEADLPRTSALMTERVLIRQLERRGDLTDYFILREVLRGPVEEQEETTVDVGDMVPRVGCLTEGRRKPAIRNNCEKAIVSSFHRGLYESYPTSSFHR